MRNGLILYASMLGLAIGVTGGCSNTLGQDPNPLGPLEVMHLVFLDQNRGTNPDLTNNARDSCSNDNPCVAPVRCGELFFYGASSGVAISFPLEPGFCHDPESINEVAPSVDAALRIAFNKQVDVSGIEDSTGTINAAAVTVRDAAGNPVAGEIVYDRTGSQRFTSDPNILPYGPALVFTPSTPLAPGTQYTIQLSPSLVKARANPEGAPISTPSATHTFTTEGLFVMGYINCPETSAGGTGCLNDYGTFNYPDPEARLLTDPPADHVVARNQALQYRFNADVSPTSLGGITVRDAAGSNVPVVATTAVTFDDEGQAQCPPQPSRLVNIVPVLAGNVPTNWTPGTYTVTIPGSASGVQAANGTARTSQTYSVTFPVADEDAPPDDPFAIGSSVVLCP